jgi:hypothetical protein
VVLNVWCRVNCRGVKCMVSSELSIPNSLIKKSMRARRGRDGMVVGFTTTCAISDYHH